MSRPGRSRRRSPAISQAADSTQLCLPETGVCTQPIRPHRRRRLSGVLWRSGARRRRRLLPCGRRGPDDEGRRLRLRRACRIVAPGRRAGLSIPGQSGVAASATRFGGPRLRRAGAGSDRRVLLAGAAARDGGALAAEQQRGRLDHGRLLRRIHARRAGAGHADRSGRSRSVSISSASPLTVAGHALFAAFADGFWSALRGARLDRHRLGRDLHDRPQAARRQGRRKTAVARDGRARGEHRHLRRALVRLRRFARAASEAGASPSSPRPQRRARVAHRLPRGARAARSRDRRRAPALFDFRPVLRNRSAMAYAIVYGIHTLEMSALRGWGVAFLAFVAAATGAVRRRRFRRPRR